jgi:hypothetical protein
LQEQEKIEEKKTPQEPEETNTEETSQDDQMEEKTKEEKKKRNIRFPAGMIESVSKFSLNRTKSNGAIWKLVLTIFSRTVKKRKNLGQVLFKFQRYA